MEDKYYLSLVKKGVPIGYDFVRSVACHHQERNEYFGKWMAKILSTMFNDKATFRSITKKYHTEVYIQKGHSLNFYCILQAVWSAASAYNYVDNSAHSSPPQR